MNAPLHDAPQGHWEKTLTHYIVVSLSLIFILISATACTDDPDEGGIIGTGIVLHGSVSAAAVTSNNVVDVKSSDGLLTQIPINSNNQFSTSSLAGAGPWVLSVHPPAGEAVHTIAYDDSTRNINRFSDVSLRRWFAERALDLDSEFNKTAPFSTLPTATEFADSVSRVVNLIEPVLLSYNVIGESTISSDYIANDQGIDAFLNRNTVLIENDLVTFVFTDPTTNTQSITRSALPLESTFLDDGENAPTVPGSVRALGSASDEIVLVWEPSTDDVAVLGYRVLRDGALIATTPYPVYIDSGLMIQPYAYEIIAIDGAGTTSAASLPALASPLQISDVTPPPAPTLLAKLTSSGSAIQLYWAQSNIEDVVGFKLYRGSDALTLDLLLQVTSTIATDTTVEENKTYCYQITAIDASNNESSRSDVLCVTANDTNASNGDTNLPLVEWNVPDIDSLVCNQQITNAQIQQGTTVIAAGCYSVPETLEIGAGATLTLTQGTILKFSDMTKIIIPKNATLTSNGTPESPVVLTGEFNIPGSWGGIEFQGSTSSGNLLRGTVIQYAGGADTRTAINITKAASRFRMTDTLVRFNKTRAIQFDFIGVTIDEFHGNQITENDSVGFVSLPLIQSLVGNSDFSGNLVDVLDVSKTSYTDVQITVADLGIPYSWNGVTITGGALTIQPGVEFSMLPNALVEMNGTFIAAGTAELPISMKGRLTDSQGTWKGLRLTGSGDKSIKHLNMQFAGEARPNTGAIDVVCNTTNATTISIDNVNVTDSASWGIFITGDNCNAEISDNNTYFNNAAGDINAP